MLQSLQPKESRPIQLGLSFHTSPTHLELYWTICSCLNSVMISHICAFACNIFSIWNTVCSHPLQPNLLTSFRCYLPSDVFSALQPRRVLPPCESLPVESSLPLNTTCFTSGPYYMLNKLVWIEQRKMKGFTHRNEASTCWIKLTLSPEKNNRK